MQALSVVIFHFSSGSASGSFFMPYKKVKGFSWDSFCITGALSTINIEAGIAVIMASVSLEAISNYLK